MYPQEDEFDQNDNDDLTETGVATEIVTTPVSGKKPRLTQEDLESDPAIQKMVDAMVERKLKVALEEGRTRNLSGTGMSVNRNTELNRTTPRNSFNVNKENRNMVKSPSDMTIYAAALKKTPNNCIGQVGNLGNQGSNDSVMINKISNFIQGIRIDSSRKSPGQQQQPIIPSDEDLLAAGNSGDLPGVMMSQEDLDMEEVRKTAEKIIVKAEQFKASVVPPQPGTYNDQLQKFELSKFNNFDELMDKIKGSIVEDQDDKFFHVTFHIDSGLKAKIEKGEFVELEKLLPRNRFQTLKDDRKLQFFYQDGETFFAPAEKESKISNVR